MSTNQYIIYQITHKINSKSYIGVTKLTPTQRLRKHFRDARAQRYRSKFHTAIRKYRDWEMWNIRELYVTCNRDHAYEAEMVLIESYNTFYAGYNSTKGGDGRYLGVSGREHPCYGRSRPVQERKQISESKRANPCRNIGSKNGMFGRSHSATTKQRLSVLMKGRYANQTHEERFGAERASQINSQRSESLKRYCATIRRGGGSNRNAKTFHLVAPDGTLHTITGNLRPFCKQQGLEVGATINLLKGRRQEYKGWSTGYERETLTTCTSVRLFK